MHSDDIRIERWSPSDRPLLNIANSDGMTRYLGGPETTSQLDQRHANYLRFWSTGEARMFRIVAGDAAVGGIGWWSTTWRDQPVHETGWFVAPEGQGRGVASAVVALVLNDVRENATLELLTAFPSVENAASNALCRRLGFELAGEEEFPFRGVTLRVNAWTIPTSGA